MTPTPPPVRISDGAVALGGRPVLRGIDLTVGDGEVVAVLGSNGSGKSTLVRAALGLTPLARGEVRLFGTLLARFSGWRRIGYVPQRPAASSGVPATVREVVTAGRLARRRLLRPLSRRDHDAIEAALAAVDLSGRQHDSVSTLSGGQQQRVLIARALAGEPDLFVLDEPTAGVDLASQLAFAEALTEVATAGATIILVAHELGPMEPLIDRAVVVSDGRIVHDGAPQATAGLHAFHDHAHPEPPVDHSPLGDGWSL
ncbi:MAG: ATP-binding cassette domain-containing protein [Propionibacteriales bacterium]|nr:ATP-binding cassette domain-containing protein [Propionibacteriales bacterium]